MQFALVLDAKSLVTVTFVALCEKLPKPLARPDDLLLRFAGPCLLANFEGVATLRLAAHGRAVCAPTGWVASGFLIADRHHQCHAEENHQWHENEWVRGDRG
jgi:hypothetical protein